MEREKTYRQLSEEISIAELWSIIKRRLGIIIISIVSFGVLAFLITQFLITPIFQSSALLIVNNRKDTSSDNISSEELTSSAKLASLYNIIIKSSSVMDPVVKTVVSEWTATDLANNVKVTAVDNTQIIRITVSHSNPELAQRYVKEIVTVAPEVIREAVEAGSVKVIEYPKIPTSSSSPNLKLNILIAMLLGAIDRKSVV